jgi:hypothetical protein
MRCKIAKAAYDKRRREAKAVELKTYDKVRNALRRADPAYAEAQRKRKADWRLNNREMYLTTNREYDAKQLRENLQRRISKNLRHRLRKAMLGQTRGLSAVRDLGLSISEFRQYMEGLFSDGMTWGNYGEWEIDHVKPLALFDLSIDAQVLIACNYKNLQPLWAADNRKKHANYGGVV